MRLSICSIILGVQNVVSRSTDKDKLFGEKAKHERLKAGKSRREVAGYMDISQQQLEKYETAENRISAGKLVEIAAALKINILQVVPLEFLDLENVDNMAIHLWTKLSYQNKKTAISVLREMAK